MDKTILELVSLFDNSKNVITDFKNVYKRFRIIKEEKKFLYPYLSNILTNVRDVIDGKKIFLKNCGINIDDNYFIIIDNILENLNNIDNIAKKGGMKLSVNNDNMDLLNIVKITEGNDNYNKINIKNSTNSNNLSIKNIQLFFKNIYENFNKINNIKSFKEIKLTKFEIINNKNIGSIKPLLQYFDKLLKRSDNEHNNNSNENNYKKNIKNIKNSKKLFYDKIFINFLKNYKFLKKPYYEIDILRIINDFNLLTKLIYKFNNKLKKDNNFDIFNIYFKILYELFHINLANNNVVENKVFIFTIIIFVSNIISQFFNKINNQKIGETKMKKTFNHIIIYLFITSLFLISMIISILKLDKKKNNNQKGGILIETNDEYAFGHFMSNCKFEFFSKGVNGLIIVASLNEGVNSLYKHINLNNFGTQVKKLIIKLVFIYDDESNENINNIFINDDYEFDQSSKQDFMNEVNIQTEIFLKTFEYLQPVCPAIVYSDIYNSESKALFRNIFLKIDMFGKKLFAIILKQFGKEIKNIGLIAMEYAEDYKPLYKYPPNTFYNIGKYLLIDLALKTGYTHSDFHTNNILLNINGNNYFKDIKGSPLIIDFGWAKKIPPSILNVLKKFYNDKKYNKILKIFCNLRRRNGKNLKNYEVFDWICKTECDDEKIEELIISRKLAIDDNVKLFEEKHEENNAYPLLPLSKKMRNSMYSGIFMNEK
jgi:hypothetical protein